MFGLSIGDLQKNWRQDLLAGFIVFMVALPLCVGISVASGAPATAGLITAIFGGIVGSLISGSYVTINGPAAGLIAIALACVQEMGHGVPMDGYRALLACTVVAGGIQIVIGLLRGGSLGLAFPSTVVHAMLSAIGVIIISKQAHVLLGVSPTATSPFGLMAEFPKSVMNLNPEIALIGAAALVLMIGLSGRKSKALRFVPVPLLAVLAGVGFGLFFDLEHEHMAHFLTKDFMVGPKFLLNIPDSLSAAIFFPNFSVLSDPVAWKHIFMITFVASTESILSACAVDRLDPEKRKTNLDRELVGKGICNMLAASVGGLPMIAEIVRSSANISNGAKSQWSNFFHGGFLLLFILVAPQYLHLVPLAALAGVLVFVGYNLAKPDHFMHAWEKGRDQGIVFATTLIAILATDLLVGVIIGAAVEFAFNVYRSRTLNLFRLNVDVQEEFEGTTIAINGPVAFTNYLPLKSQIERIGGGRRLTIDLRASRSIDQTVMEHLSRHASEIEMSGNTVDILFSDAHHSSSGHMHAARYLRRGSARVDGSVN